MSSVKNIKMSFDEWIEKYNPIHNPNGEGIVAGEKSIQFNMLNEDDHKQVTSADKMAVWTLYDGEFDEDDEEADVKMMICNGLSYTNAVGHFITEQKFNQAENIEVLLD